ncbi:NmrA family NAD(P)-binding protein [Streptomyces sp. NBC_00304]|uniref:NmrA family NAD(P)-binding protein n=1 Tax=Streptomyces sp. NBC_00304 TaxID=2975706 RepID=UPI003FA6CB82
MTAHPARPTSSVPGSRPAARLVAVTGATGKQGGATARRLLAAGTPVRALVRDTTAPAALALQAAGAELALGDFDDPSSLPAALEGAAGLFAVPPLAYGPEAPTRSGSSPAAGLSRTRRRRPESSTSCSPVSRPLLTGCPQLGARSGSRTTCVSGSVW